MATVRPAEGDTFAQILEWNAENRGKLPAIREKHLGIWQTWTWSMVREEIRLLAHGLSDIGVKRGDKVAIIGDNRPRLYWSIVAAQAIGAVPVPMYQDAAAKEMQFVVDHAETRFAIAEDQEQVDKLMETMDLCESLEQIVYSDPRGMRNYTEDYIHSFDSLEERGRAHMQANPSFYNDEIAKSGSDDTAIFLYTSGTTGNPKGVVLTFKNLVSMGRMSVELEKLAEDEDTLAYLPLAWVGDNIFSIAQSYVAGFCVNCPESQATVLQDLREIGPTYFFAPPRIFENVLTTVHVRMEDAGRLKRGLFDRCMKLAKRVGVAKLNGHPVSMLDRFKYWLGGIFVYQPLKNALGFSRMRRVYTAGEAIGPDIFDFYRALGLNMKQLYGQTESTVFVTMQPDDEVYPDTVGIPCPGVEVKVDEATGEVLYRSSGVFKEYYRNPEATAEAKTDDGWVHTGDAGFFDTKKHLKIIDRAKDVGKLNDGAMFAPKYLENKLKFFPFIREVVTFGDQHEFVTAMISIDPDAVGNWAERNNVSYASYRELTSKETVYEIIRENLEQVNQELASDPAMASSQIHRFVLLHKELDADDGELTRTRKVRRRFVAERYKEVIDALYGGASEIHVEIETTFEDGRTGVSAGDLLIVDVPTVAAAPAKAAA